MSLATERIASVFSTHSTALYRDVAVTARGRFVPRPHVLREAGRGAGESNNAFGLAGEKRGSTAGLTEGIGTVVA